MLGYKYVLTHMSIFSKLLENDMNTDVKNNPKIIPKKEIHQFDKS